MSRDSEIERILGCHQKATSKLVVFLHQAYGQDPRKTIQKSRDLLHVAKKKFSGYINNEYEFLEGLTLTKSNSDADVYNIPQLALSDGSVQPCLTFFKFGVDEPSDTPHIRGFRVACNDWAEVSSTNSVLRRYTKCQEYLNIRHDGNVEHVNSSTSSIKTLGSIDEIRKHMFRIPVQLYVSTDIAVVIDNRVEIPNKVWFDARYGTIHRNTHLKSCQWPGGTKTLKAFGVDVQLKKGWETKLIRGKHIVNGEDIGFRIDAPSMEDWQYILEELVNVPFDSNQLLYGLKSISYHPLLELDSITVKDIEDGDPLAIIYLLARVVAFAETDSSLTALRISNLKQEVQEEDTQQGLVEAFENLLLALESRSGCSA